MTPNLKCDNCGLVEKEFKFCPECGVPSSLTIQSKPAFAMPDKVPAMYDQSNATNKPPPKPQQRFYTPPQSPVQMDSNDEKPKAGGDNTETWECKHCTFINTYDSNICAICSKTSWIQIPAAQPVAHNEQKINDNKPALNNTPNLKNEKPVVKEKPAVAPKNVQKSPNDASKSNKGGWVRRVIT